MKKLLARFKENYIIIIAWTIFMAMMSYAVVVTIDQGKTIDRIQESLQQQHLDGYRNPNPTDLDWLQK